MIHLEKREDCYIILIIRILDFCMLDKSCVLESTRKGKMFSVVNKTKQVSVCLGTGSISAAVSVGGAGRALIGSLGNRHWDLVGGRPAAGIAPLSVPPSPNPPRQTTATKDRLTERNLGGVVFVLFLFVVDKSNSACRPTSLMLTQVFSGMLPQIVGLTGEWAEKEQMGRVV